MSTPLSKNELMPEMAALQKRGGLGKFVVGAASTLMLHGAAQAAELSKSSDPREAAAYAQFVDTMRTQPLAAAPPAKFVLDPDLHPTRRAGNVVVSTVRKPGGHTYS